MITFLANIPSLPFLSKYIEKDCEIANLRGKENAYANLAILSFLISFVLFYYTIGLFLSLLFSLFVGYYVLTIPRYKALVKIVQFRSDSLLSSLYISVSVLFTRNLEQSLDSAASLLNNSSSKVLKEIVSGLKNGRFKDLDEALEKIKVYDPSFSESIKNLEVSLNERTRKSFEESIDYVLKQLIYSNILKMREFMESTINPIRILFSVFILLPLMLLIILPIVSVFLSEEIPLHSLIVMFNLLIPLVVLFYSQRILLKRPPTLIMLFLPKVKESKPYLPAIGVFALFFSLSLFPFEDYVSFGYMLRSIFITTSFAMSAYTYYYLKSKPFKGLIEKRDKIVRDFKSFLYELSLKLSSGISFESALDSLKSKINIKSEFYVALLSLIKQSAERSTKGASFVVKKILGYIESIENVDEDTKDLFSETTSTLHLLVIFVVPLVGAIAVSLGSLIIHFLNVLSSQITDVSLPGSYSLPFISASSMLPAYILQLIVGIYVVQMIVIISRLEHVIKYGFSVQNISSNILIGYLVYVLVLLLSIPLLKFIPGVVQ